jgi:hypothetical protein
MPVYIDDMHTVPMGKFRRMKMSHLIADSDAELNAMADKIGVARKWFQDTISGPHYDISITKRKLAVKAGAVEITMRQCAMMCANRRNGLVEGVGDPATAETIWRASRSTPTSSE